ncbi:MAG: hypothetical protein SW019_21950, partial [Actinomycetota bacterium]|nr:hypothetical protein [Actinomycetota bacterium]
SAPEPGREIPWPQMGLPEQVELVGANQSNTVSVPIPAGVEPTRFTGLIGSIVNTTDGRLDILDSRGVTLADVPIRADRTTVPFDVDISQAQVSEGKAPLTFVLRDGGEHSDSCTRPPSVVLSSLASAYSGPIPDPATVAGFLPGYLSEIKIHVGPEPTHAQTQAALNLVAALTHLYRPMPVQIDVETTEEVPTPRPDVRVITIRDGSEAGVTVEEPGTPRAVLAITGTGDDLVRQVTLFGDQRYAIAQSDYANTLSDPDSVLKATTVQTFDELGIAGDISVQGVSTLYAGFDAGAFGVGSITSARIHLKAHYTPVVGATASVIVRSGSTVLASSELDESGVLDVTGEIPPESVTSNIGMAMEIQYIPDQECAPLNNRMRFTIDPDSTVEVTPGPENRGGFPVLPMAFAPEFDVALERPDQVGWAAQAINLMAQHSGTVLRPHLNTLAESAGSSTGLLAVGAGSTLADAGLVGPLMPGPDHTVDIDTTSTVDIDGNIGAVQAFTQNDRTVLAITGTGDWSGVAASLAFIRELPNRWASLTGDVVAAGPGNDAVNLTLQEGGALVNEYPGDGWKWWALASGGLVLAALLAGAALLLLRLRRPRP